MQNEFQQRPMKKILFFFCFLTQIVSAQTRFYDLLNPTMKQIASPESEEHWIRFNSSAKVNPETIFEVHKTAFELSANDKMLVNKSFIDDIGFTHINYQQYFKGVPIDGESVNVHINKNGETYAATGRILKGIAIETTPKLTANEALEAALKFVNAKEYMWQNTYWENELKQKKNDPNATYYPSPTLVIKEKRSQNQGLGIFNLVYRIDIDSSSPHYSQRVFVDALSGEIIDKYPLESN